MGDNLIGYARVSTADQNHDLQHDALTAAGCTRVFSDIASGALDKRPQLDALLDYLRPGDVLVVWRLDRLGRSVRHLGRLVRSGAKPDHKRHQFRHVLPVEVREPCELGEHGVPGQRTCWFVCWARPLPRLSG